MFQQTIRSQPPDDAGEAERPRKLDRRTVAELARVTARLAEMFETATEVLQEAQDLVPAPTLAEVAEMREGKRPLTREAYLLGLFQSAMLGAENLGSDLRAVTRRHGFGKVPRTRLTEVELNAIEEAVSRRSS